MPSILDHSGNLNMKMKCSPYRTKVQQVYHPSMRSQQESNNLPSFDSLTKNYSNSNLFDTCTAVSFSAVDYPNPNEFVSSSSIDSSYSDLASNSSLISSATINPMTNNVLTISSLSVDHIYPHQSETLASSTSRTSSSSYQSNNFTKASLSSATSSSANQSNNFVLSVSWFMFVHILLSIYEVAVNLKTWCFQNF